MTTLANPTPLTRAIPESALALRGAFHPTPQDLVPNLPDGTQPGTLLLLGWTGGAQWPAFTASPEYRDQEPDPLDRYTRRLLAKAATELNAQALHPGEGPPYLPFQRWAIRAEALTQSPLGLLIHPQWGLWHAYRGALALRERLPLTETPPPPNPCESCPRLVMRAPHEADFPAYANLMASLRATFMGGPYKTRAAPGACSATTSPAGTSTATAP